MSSSKWLPASPLFTESFWLFSLASLFIIITHPYIKLPFLNSKAELLKRLEALQISSSTWEGVFFIMQVWKKNCFSAENTALEFLNSVSCYGCETIITQFIVFKGIYCWSWNKREELNFEAPCWATVRLDARMWLKTALAERKIQRQMTIETLRAGV